MSPGLSFQITTSLVDIKTKFMGKTCKYSDSVRHFRCLPCPLVPKVIALDRVAVNHLCTVSPDLSQHWRLCSVPVRCWAPSPVMTPSVIQVPCTGIL